MARTYLATKNATATVNGTAFSIADGSFDEEVGDEDVTNTQSGGYYEEVLTIRKMTFSGLKIIYDSTNVPSWAVGDSITLDLSIPSGSHFNGVVHLKKIGRKMLTVRGAFTLTIDGNSHGTYTMTN